MTTRTILPTAEEKPVYVNRMFARIAPTYDLMNRLMTFGQDQRWRSELLDLCNLPARGSLLDVGTGTGDIAYAAMDKQPSVRAFGADFTYEMMAAGVGKSLAHELPFTQADTYHLPYPDDTFDAVVSGFLVGDGKLDGFTPLVDRLAAFCEMRRVSKPGGRVICLETTPPNDSLIGRLSQFYVMRIVPLFGSLISGDGSACSYLPQSTVTFMTPDELRQTMEQARLRNVFYRMKMFNTVAIHVGMK